MDVYILFDGGVRTVNALNVAALVTIAREAARYGYVAVHADGGMVVPSLGCDQ